MKNPTVEPMIGQCPGIVRAMEMAECFAPTSVSMLLVGATGTGKELLARTIHRSSGRSGRFVDVNCGALPHDLAEGLLFGHRRGAYTGAFETVAGLVEAASGGTLFLDELESLPPASQVKLLRVLESGEVRRLGEAEKRAVDFRVVATAKDDLRARIQSGAFRLDLFQRVAGVVVELPRLRDRGSDIVVLAERFARCLGRGLQLGTETVITNYAWPGNVRELRSAVERVVVLTNGSGISPAAFAEAIAMGTPPTCQDIGGASDCDGGGNGDLDRRRLISVLSSNGWHGGRTAEALGIGRTTLFRKLKRMGISLSRCRRGYQEYQ